MDVLALNRKIFTDKSTIGDLCIYGEKFCDVLEDTCRRVKIEGQTAIPSGRYRLVINHSQRYGRLMPRLLGVPGYDGILIHSGNTDKETKGCLLVGRYDPSTPSWISDSRNIFDRLFNRLNELKASDPEMWINVRGGFQHEERVAA